MLKKILQFSPHVNRLVHLKIKKYTPYSPRTLCHHKLLDNSQELMQIIPQVNLWDVTVLFCVPHKILNTFHALVIPKSPRNTEVKDVQLSVNTGCRVKESCSCHHPKSVLPLNIKAESQMQCVLEGCQAILQLIQPPKISLLALNGVSPSKL